MSKLFRELLKSAPVVVGVSLLAASPSFAQETNQAQILDELNSYSQEVPGINENYDASNDPMSQVTSVSQLRDVSPGDWAFEALRNLVERYGCIAGYPDRTFRGNQPLTRYEFAAGLNACLQQIERLIAAGGNRGGSGMSEEEMQQMQRLTQEFQAELATIGARVDNLEARVGVVEKQQFSTTTKLKGEVIFSAGGVFGDERSDKAPGNGEPLDDNITLSNRVRLNFDTSFTGKDLLRTRLSAGNIPNLANASGTDMASLGYAGLTNNDVQIEDLYYRFPLGKKVNVWVGTQGLDLDDIFNVHNDKFADSGTGALSRFNRYNPAVYRSTQGAGLGAKYKFNDNVALSALYLAGSNASNPNSENGLFDGAYSAGAQLDVNLGKAFDLGVTYVHSYQPGSSVNLSGSTGSQLAKDPFGGLGTSAHRIGLSGQWRPNEKISLGAFGGYVNANAEESGKTDVGLVNSGDKADIWTWGANIALLDFGGEGNVLGIAGGMAPKLTGSDIVNGGNEVKNEGNGYIVEAHYRWQVNDNIQITPGAYVIFEPNHVDGASEIFVGTLRTTFKF